MNNCSSNRQYQEYRCKATTFLNKATKSTNGGVILPIEEQDNNGKNVREYTLVINLFFFLKSIHLGPVGSYKSLLAIYLFLDSEPCIVY